MTESYFQHYVVNGGWAMLLLVPACLVMFAAIVRAMLVLTRQAIIAEGERSSPSALQRVMERMQQIRSVHGIVTAEDVRSEIFVEVTHLYSFLVPLTAVFILAPLAGVLGAITALMNANIDLARGVSPGTLAISAERALVAPAWGVGISLVAYLAYAILRLRLYYCETRLLRPAVEKAIATSLNKTGLQR